MLLVISTQGNVFQPPGTVSEPADAKNEPFSLSSLHNLWEVTWQYLDQVLPGLKDELFGVNGTSQIPPPRASATDISNPTAPGNNASAPPTKTASASSIDTTSQLSTPPAAASDTNAPNNAELPLPSTPVPAAEVV
jgi:hypothetical protein